MRHAFALLFVLPLIACGGRDPVANGANDTEALPTVNQPAPNATGAPPRNQTATGKGTSTPPPVVTIPAALQGRWGLTPGDCTSTRGDAKGLLIISGDDLRFYESRAVPEAGVDTAADRVSGTFAFTGEGQSWTKFQALELQDGNLVRTQSNPNASFTYAKCR